MERFYAYSSMSETKSSYGEYKKTRHGLYRVFELV
ncbi:MAG: hypothetical protein JWO99_182 [Candidatus Saccharibacteria bacterium]|nr:hypothetical protein [Candidatus Saccharibacteria bacterium]